MPDSSQPLNRAVAPRDAATVLLLRDGARLDGTPALEVYLLRRLRAMSFAGGMTAYPGGRVDPRDANADIGWHGPTPAQWAEEFHCDETTARALVCAVVRETFEESGVLLAARANGDGSFGEAPDTRGAGWEADRVALVEETLSLAELLRRRDLLLRADLLRPFAHWITPARGENQRFDTRFFAAAIPTGVEARDVSGEADQAGWHAVADALADYERGERPMLPPTLQTLSDLSAFATVADALAGSPPRPITPIQPTFVEDADGAWIVLPDGRRIRRSGR